MNIDLVAPQPVKSDELKETKDILVEGKKVGCVDHYPERSSKISYHVCFDLSLIDNYQGFGGIVQGYGDSIKNAIKEALERAEAFNRDYEIKLKQLKRMLSKNSDSV